MLFFNKKRDCNSSKSKSTLILPTSPGITFTNLKRTVAEKENMRNLQQKSKHGEKSKSTTEEKV